MNAQHILFTATIMALGGSFTSAFANGEQSVDIVRGTLDGHAYQNGGIGKEQAADLERRITPYDLRLTFSAGKHNAYATGLEVKISNAVGRKVFSLDDAGPLTDVNLPTGHYRVVADFGGIKRSGSIEVRKGEPANLYLHWPEDET